MRTGVGVFGQGPTPALLFSAAEPAHGGIACGEIITRANWGDALRACCAMRSACGMSMRLSTARVRPSITYPRPIGWSAPGSWAPTAGADPSVASTLSDREPARISGMPSPGPIVGRSQILSASAPSPPLQLPMSGMVSTYTKDSCSSVNEPSLFTGLRSGGSMVSMFRPVAPS